MYTGHVSRTTEINFLLCQKEFFLNDASFQWVQKSFWHNRKFRFLWCQKDFRNHTICLTSLTRAKCGTPLNFVLENIEYL